MDKGGVGMKRFIIPTAFDAFQSFLGQLSTDELYSIEIAPYHKRLPSNLRSRIKILGRELAAWNGITYEEFNGIVHRLYYPKRDRVIAGQTVESSIPTNELTPDEARIIESELYSLGATLGCPLSIPQSK